VRNTLLPAIDARWEAYGQILRYAQPQDETCVFMVDLGDVRPLRDPGELCVRHPEALFVSSDICRKDSSKGFLRYQLNQSGYHASRLLQAFLSPTTRDTYVHNAGVIGGSYKRVFDPFRRWIAYATRKHYLALDGPPRYVMDAVLLNDAMLHFHGEVYGGYPRGFLNLPMGGDFCLWNPVPYCRVANFPRCSAKDMLAAMAHNYYFSHKIGCGKHLLC